MKKDLKQFRESCQQYPIMSDEGLDVILKDLNAKDKLLEIGTCVGYSALYLATHQDITITTIERDDNRAKIAKENLASYPQITLIHQDALTVELDEVYDVILFDAAKAQNQAFFEKFQKNLKPGGLLFVDNVFFHGYVQDPEQVKDRKNLYRMVLKMKAFVEQMLKSDLDVEIIDVGDGLMRIKFPY